MTVKELIEKLQTYDEDAVIRVAGQPNYPMEQSFIGVAEGDGEGNKDRDDECERPGCYDARSNHPNEGACIAKDIDTGEPCECEGWMFNEENMAGVWLVVGDNIDYGVPRDIFQTARYGW